MYLGRFQQGGAVPLSVYTADSEGTVVQPDAAPTATILDADSNPVSVVKLPMGFNATHFSFLLFIGIAIPLGTYTVEYAWSVGAFAGSSADSFDVIHGGDVGGRVISMFAYDRPEARYVVAQLSSGNLVQGRNPKF